jgi:hypothetical protein
MRLLIIGGLASLLAFACSASDGTPRPVGLNSNAPGCSAGSCDECTTCLDGCLCEGTAEALCVAHCGGGDSSGGASGTAGSGSGDGGGGEPGASGATGGQAAQPSNCTYPTDAAGVSEGKVVRGNLKWQGFLEGSTQETTIPIANYHDCDGTKGINALLISTGALWCPNCNQETAEFDANMTSRWSAMGIKIISLIIEDNYQNKATMVHAEQWRAKHGGKHFAIGIDPAFSFANFGENGLPTQIVVNPRNMQIVYRQEGYSPNYPNLENLARQNAQ